jgi:L-ribulokinase
MTKRQYAIGVDFGTESGRALLVDVASGAEIAAAVHPYASGVITERLPGAARALDPDWALQDPADYLEVLKRAVPAVLAASGVDPSDVIGLGVSCTSCTMLPVTADGTPLSFLPEWRDQPHAWTKLWKHHAAQPEATRLNEIAAARGEPFLARYGGKISAEWFFPKAWQILDEAPAVYVAADRLIEAGDWIVWLLTGAEKRSASLAGYKELWAPQTGYPPEAFFAALDPRLAQIVRDKLPRACYPLGAQAGGLTAQAARWTGLQAGAAVAVASIDAHASVPAATVTAPGALVIIIGTATCHLLLDTVERAVPGICGSVADGVVPDYVGYEAGQPCVGDGLAWFAARCVPAVYAAEAEARGLTIHQWLETLAARLQPGESGLLALDWWNGNRSVLVDADLSSLLLGATLATKPEEINRAFFEATAYGTRLIIDTFEAQGLANRQLVATGGLPERNRLLPQIYADVTGRPLRLAATTQGSALGAAIHGAVAAGAAAGGYDTFTEASAQMSSLRREVYTPTPRHQQVYDRLYAEYVTLHDYFGRGANDVMRRLKRLRLQVTG